jgi:hypothetical protein
MIYFANLKKKVILDTQFYDPHISRIEKILAQNGPKFLDLYASIYGNTRVYTVILNSKSIQKYFERCVRCSRCRRD